MPHCCMAVGWQYLDTSYSSHPCHNVPQVCHRAAQTMQEACKGSRRFPAHNTTKTLTCLLIVILHTLGRQRGVDDKAHIRLVYPHAKGHRSHNHLHSTCRPTGYPFEDFQFLGTSGHAVLRKDGHAKTGHLCSTAGVSPP